MPFNISEPDGHFGFIAELRQLEAHYSDHDAAAIEAGRILRRATLCFPDGSELIEEEDFMRPGNEAA